MSATQRIAMSDSVKPLFLFSLPRCGSTLLQRMLAAHGQIASAAEPWILLPIIYSMKESGAYTEYSHRTCVQAVRGFCRELPKGEDSYKEALKALALRLYREAAPAGARYFLDKTPPYCFIANQILEMFPESPAIFLFRSPGGTVASLCNSFGAGKWTIPAWKQYLYHGLDDMLCAYEQHRGRSHALRYEDLIADPERELKKLFEYLHLDYDPRATTDFAGVKFKGRIGDQTGRYQYTTVNPESLFKWKATLGNPLRKHWYKRYLAWLGPERLELMGYSMEKLLQQADSIPMGYRFLLSDAMRMARAPIAALIEPHQIREKLAKLPRWYEVVQHR